MLLLAAAGSGTVVVPPLTAERQIVSRTAALTRVESASSSHLTDTVRRAHPVRAYGKDLRLEFGQAQYAPSYTVRASLEVNGTVFPCTFGGAVEAVVADKAGVLSDPIAVIVRPGDVVFSRTYSVIPSNAPTSFQSAIPVDVALGDGHQAGDATSGGFVSDGYADNTRGPLAIRATAEASARAVAWVGDSILALTATNWCKQIADRDGLPWTQAALGGDAIIYGRWTSHFSRGVSAYTHMISQFGANDRFRDVPTTQAQYVALWKWAADQGVKVLQSTVLPVSSSSDGFTTLGGQTPDGGNRDIHNRWYRDGAPLVSGTPVAPGTTGAVRAGQVGHPLVGIIDVAAAVESAPESGKWRVDIGSIGGDGLHPAPLAHTLIANSISSSVLA